MSKVVYKVGDDVSTDIIYPGRYMATVLPTETPQFAFADDAEFNKKLKAAEIPHGSFVVAGENFGCGSSREHAVWALEVNDINLVIAESFARIFRQNMFNCGILAITLDPADLNRLFALRKGCEISVDLDKEQLTATESTGQRRTMTCAFNLNPFDRKLVQAGGWLSYADQNY